MQFLAFGPLLLEKMNKDLYLHMNFFQPILKSFGKQSIDGKTIKYYDHVETPYRRILVSEEIAFSNMVHLTSLLIHLNPVALLKRIDMNVGKLWKIINQHSNMRHRYQ